MTYYAIDFEADYDKEYGIEECGVYGYLNHEKFNPYLMSVWGEDIQWVGHPNDCPTEIWNKLASADALLAHHAGFDQLVMQRCCDLMLTPWESSHFFKWYCTANLSVFLGAPRNLKEATKELLGIEISKEMRNYMKGRTWEQAVAEGKSAQLEKYALDDSMHCYNIWMKYHHLWPEVERRTAEITFIQTQRGVTVDKALLDEALPKVIAARDEALARIPWVGQKDKSGDEYKPLSALAFKAWCKENGITPPETTEAKNPEFMKWQEEHSDVSVVKAMQTYRSANALALKGTTLRSQIRPDGRYGFDMKYYGATTGRWSAGYEDERTHGTGVNIQNLIKDEMYGLNLRKAFVAAPGKKFVVSDYSQIEPRCLAWLCDDTEFMDKLREGVPLYEAHARAQGSWTGSEILKKVNPKLYLQKKAEVLALGYGAGWAKFIFMCKMYGAEDCLFSPVADKDRRKFEAYIKRTHQQDKLLELKTEIDWTKAVNAWLIVTEFRNSKTKITNLWKVLEQDCMRCHGGKYEIELPSGRILPYFDVKTIGGLTLRKTMGGGIVRVWGGFLTENLVQATARDVMRDAIIRLEDAGIPTLFTVHDEIICEVDKDFPKEEIRRLMTIVPDWIPGLPVEIEQEETDYYKK